MGQAHTERTETLAPPAPAAAPALDAAPRGVYRSLPHVPSLDGLRGLAIVGVLAFHGGVAFTGGFLGVSMFFTLSGFLITGLLLSEQAGRRIGSRHIDLRAFWGRRVRRLLPAALVAIALSSLLVWRTAGPAELLAFRADALAALLYGANWHFVIAGQSYASLFAAPSPVLQFWSLAIEEQFYILFPLLAYGILRLAHGSRRILAAVLAGLFVVSAALPHVFSWSNDRIYFGTDTRAAELLAGALLAVTLSLRGCAIDAVDAAWSPRTRRAVAVAGTVALALILFTWWSTSQASAWVYAGGLPLYSGLSALVVLAALVPASPVRRALSWRPFRELGRISYGLYLYHWPVFLALAPARTGWAPLPRFVVGTAVAIGLAVVSSIFIEEPIRSRRPWRSLDPEDPFASLRRPPSRIARLAPLGIGVGIAMVLVVTITPPPSPSELTLDVAAGTLVSDVDRVSFARPDRARGIVPFTTIEPRSLTGRTTTTPGSAVPPTDPTAAPSATDPINPTTTATTTPVDPTGPSGPPGPSGPLAPKPIRRPNRPLRVLVVGDSTTTFLDPALDRWGTDHQVWGAANYARIGCGIGRTGDRVNHDAIEPVPDACQHWATEWPDVLAKLQPDIVVIASSFWDATDRRLPGDDAWRAPGDPTYDRYLGREFGAAVDVLTSTGAVVTWIDNAPIHLGYNALPAHDYAVNEPARMTHTNAILASVASTRPAMRVVPYASFVDSLPDGPFAYRPDGLHVDGPGGLRTAAWMGPEILDAYWSVQATAPRPIH